MPKPSTNHVDPQDVVALVDDLLDRAAAAEASDIHVEPQEEALVIKYRLDGQLQVVERLPRLLGENVVARLKVLAGLLTYRNDIPQEGRLVTRDRAGTVVDRRLAVFPTIHGQRAVVRLLYRHADLLDLERLGLPEPVRRCVQDFAVGHQGVLLVTGPAGSGKSTTLAALMRWIVRRFPGRSVVTVEDPVEIRIPEATQIQIPPQGELTFARALRSLLRQDPEVLMLGEIRDAETVRLAVEAGLTGHLLATTLHSGSAAAALVRLLEMGVAPYQVTSGIVAVVNQRLARRLCPSCRRAAGAAYRAVGCEDCLNTGYRGRLLLAEVLHVNAAVRQALLGGADITALQRLQDDAMRVRAREQVRAGVTTEDEIRRLGLWTGA